MRHHPARRRLFTTLFLAVLALVFAGPAIAGARGASSAPPAAAGGGEAARGGPDDGNCENGVDDDGDGLTDAADPGCQLPGCLPSSQTPNKCHEEDAAPPPVDSCDDGIDNDDDGVTDADDPECQDPDDGVEDGSDDVDTCNDGTDNDDDGVTDADDPECQDPDDGVEDGSDQGGGPEACTAAAGDPGLLTDDTLGQTVWDGGGSALSPLLENPEGNGLISGPVKDALTATPLEVVGDEVGCLVDLLLDETVSPIDP